MKRNKHSTVPCDVVVYRFDNRFDGGGVVPWQRWHFLFAIIFKVLAVIVIGGDLICINGKYLNGISSHARQLSVLVVDADFFDSDEL